MNKNDVYTSSEAGLCGRGTSRTELQRVDPRYPGREVADDLCLLMEFIAPATGSKGLLL